MSEDELFVVVGAHDTPQGAVETKKSPLKGKPIASFIILGVIVLGCLAAELIMRKNPTYMDLGNCNLAPNKEFLFGTDTLGRDIFSMIWYGGRLSLSIGFLATVISTAIGILFGAISGMAPEWPDSLMMRFTEVFLSIPGLLLTVLLQAILGEASVISISVVIGLTSWTSIAKVVRTEVRQIRSSEYLVAAKCMGGGFFYLLRKHLTPNFISSIMFMVVMNVRGAIVAESTLSFMGIGLPIEVISWGSMLSMANRAMLTKSWWIIVIPGAFLVASIVFITEIGNWLRGNANKKQRVF